MMLLMMLSLLLVGSVFKVLIYKHKNVFVDNHEKIWHSVLIPERL